MIDYESSLLFELNRSGRNNNIINCVIIIFRKENLRKVLSSKSEFFSFVGNFNEAKN